MILLNRTNLQKNITELRFVASGDETLWNQKNSDTDTENAKEEFRF